ncbi:type II toxin-antitoxin system HicB family antitoxin [Candidatus Acetothermia bacterium]|nr:type II toxin-antitoxin system HicB family antitoxin [Candidatus Acetothermia bacterium]
MELTYTVIFEPAEEGGYLAHVPALNDATTQGETLEDARFWVKDLIQGYLESLLKAGQPLPTEHEKYEGEKVTIKLAVEVA